MASGRRYGRTRGMAGATIARTLSGPRVRVVANYEAWGGENSALCDVYHPPRADGARRLPTRHCGPRLHGYVGANNEPEPAAQRGPPIRWRLCRVFESRAPGTAVPLSAPASSGAGPGAPPRRWPHRADTEDGVGGRHPPGPVPAAGAAREAGRAHSAAAINLVLYHGVLVPHFELAGTRGRLWRPAGA